jgi:hypothetical protein
MGLKRFFKRLLQPKRWQDLTEQERKALMEENRTGLFRRLGSNKKVKDPRALANDAGLEEYGWFRSMKANPGRSGWGAVANLDVDRGYAESERQAKREPRK